jgi:hypothetical protein
MNKDVAKNVLTELLGAYRDKSYEDLKRLIGETEVFEALAGGTTYQIEIQVLWDSRPQGNIRVAGAIDDGGVSALIPQTADFIMTPQGTFHGE